MTELYCVTLSYINKDWDEVGTDHPYKPRFTLEALTLTRPIVYFFLQMVHQPYPEKFKWMHNSTQQKFARLRRKHR